MRDYKKTLPRHAAFLFTLCLAAFLINYYMRDNQLRANIAKPDVEMAGTGSVERRNPSPTLTDKVSHFFPNKQKSEKPAHDMSQLSSPERAVAFVKCDKMYIIDKNGHILALADSVAHVDLTVIFGEKLTVSESGLEIHGEELQTALKFITAISKYDIFAAQLSQIYIDNKYGLVAYMDWDNVIPVIIGKKNIADKIEKMESFYHNLRATSHLSQAKYVDLRLDDRAVIKKNT